MYVLKPGVKRDPARRWALLDRIFFGHGACLILSGVYLSAPPLQGFYAERIIPRDGKAGNHIYVTDGTLAFDYHGYSCRARLLAHHVAGWSRRYGGDWTYDLERVSFNLLDTMALNARKMLGPEQYFGDPIARAQAFLSRINHVAAYRKAGEKTVP